MGAEWGSDAGANHACEFSVQVRTLRTELKSDGLVQVSSSLGYLVGIVVLLHSVASSIGRSVIKGRTNGFEKHVDYLEQRLLTLGLRKEIGAEEIGAIKKKLSALCQDSRKDVLQVFQDLAGFLLLEQIQSCKGCNSLGTLCFGK